MLPNRDTRGRFTPMPLIRRVKKYSEDLLVSTKHRREAVIGLFTTIIVGEVLLPMIPPHIKAFIAYTSFALLILVLISDIPILKTISNQWLQRGAVIGIVSLIVLPIAYYGWYPLNNYFISQSQPETSLYIQKHEIITNNLFGIPVYKTVLEFGTKVTDERIDIQISTKDFWDDKTVLAWFDEPKRIDSTANSQSIYNQSLSLGGAAAIEGVQPIIKQSSPNLSLSFDGINIKNNRSIYIGLYSYKPLKFITIKSAGVNFIESGSRFIAEVK